MSFRPTDGVAQIYMVAIGPPSSPIQKPRITSWGLILLDEEDPSNATLHFIVPKPKRSFYECDQMEMVLADPLKVDLTTIANPPPSALGWNWYGVPFGTSLGHTTGLLKPGCRLEVSSPSYTLLSFVFIGKSHFLGSVLGYELFRRRIEESLALHPRYFRLMRSSYGPGAGPPYAAWSWRGYLAWAWHTTRSGALRASYRVEDTFRLNGFGQKRIIGELKERVREDEALTYGF
ncbi:hypothetical protein MD484_g6447, partial [Candolleomyces efflorescens]